jgi:hypothetical protein
MTSYELFISKNYRMLSDKQLANELSISVQGDNGVQSIRKRYSLYRAGLAYYDRNKLAKLIELWFNGSTIADAARQTDIELKKACQYISKYALYKKKSYTTITLVIESKMNFTEEEIHLIENPFLPKEIKF